MVGLVDTVLVRNTDLGLIVEPRGTLLDIDNLTHDEAFWIVKEVAITVGILGSETIGMLHGDLSIGNVILWNGQVILIDLRTLRPLAQVSFTSQDSLLIKLT